VNLNAKTWVIAHRGASAQAPENTMAAFRRAVELGSKFVETDLQLTKDARLVAMHDATLERTTNGRGLVKDYTLAEIRELDAGSWFGPQFARERVPTIENIIDFAREADIVFYLEVKSANMWGVEHALVGALRAAKEAAHAAVLSFDINALANVRRLDPTLMSGYLFDKPRPDVAQQAVGVGARQLAPRRDLLTRELVQQAHASSLQVVTWTVNEPAEMRTAIATGVNGIMTDYPDRLVAILRENQ
jgi:glycerophosphoryl diester phosphodiesterase